MPLEEITAKLVKEFPQLGMRQVSDLSLDADGSLAVVGYKKGSRSAVLTLLNPSGNITEQKPIEQKPRFVESDSGNVVVGYDRSMTLSTLGSQSRNFLFLELYDACFLDGRVITAGIPDTKQIRTEESMTWGYITLAQYQLGSRGDFEWVMKHPLRRPYLIASNKTHAYTIEEDATVAKVGKATGVSPRSSESLNLALSVEYPLNLTRWKPKDGSLDYAGEVSQLSPGTVDLDVDGEIAYCLYRNTLLKHDMGTHKTARVALGSSNPKDLNSISVRRSDSAVNIAASTKDTVAIYSI